MKKILIIVTLVFFSFNWITFAEGEMWTDDSEVVSDEAANITIFVTEKIPWANCECMDKVDDKCPTNPKYKCTIKPWFKTILDALGEFVKYFTFIASLVWVLFIVFNGIMYSMWWIEQSLKDNAKKRIVQTLIWLTLLFMSWVILNLIAPWVYVL